MTINVLVCRMDGTQTLEQREVPDDWFFVPEEENSSIPSAET